MQKCLWENDNPGSHRPLKTTQYMSLSIYCFFLLVYFTLIFHSDIFCSLIYSRIRMKLNKHRKWNGLIVTLLVSAKQISLFCYFVFLYYRKKLKWFGFTSDFQLLCWVIKGTVGEPVMSSTAYVHWLFVLYK